MFSPVTSRRDNFGQSNFMSLLFRPWKEFENIKIKIRTIYIEFTQDEMKIQNGHHIYVLSKEPHNSLSTYLRAAALKKSNSLKDYERVLGISPSDARKVPKAHYSIGFCKRSPLAKYTNTRLVMASSEFFSANLGQLQIHSYSISIHKNQAEVVSRMCTAMLNCPLTILDCLFNILGHVNSLMIQKTRHVFRLGDAHIRSIDKANESLKSGLNSRLFKQIDRQLKFEFNSKAVFMHQR
ncbi:hypothetical protein BpHYR1_006076 [Brachionus plicatilis]|uniref:Uncharacterized protein n=1 Tax=Brachionus plicatilis TaxID=10195 RepID=A0A3M7RDU8_BRAPC|nr:hypothetical protein BpHYR1_006076 [Brachionus plicatilis]